MICKGHSMICTQHALILQGLFARRIEYFELIFLHPGRILSHGMCTSGLGRGPGLTRFVCARCTATGLLSNCRLFLNRASVRHHIAACKHCCAADLGYSVTRRSMWRPGPAMSCPAWGVQWGQLRMSDTSRQVTRASRAEISVYSANQGEERHWCVSTRSAVVKLQVRTHEIPGSNPNYAHFFYLDFQSIWKYILIWRYTYIVYTLILSVYRSIYYLRLFHTMLLFMGVWESGFWNILVHTHICMTIMACLGLSGIQHGLGLKCSP